MRGSLFDIPPGLSPATWFLVFTPCATRRWWHYVLTGYDYAHVFALQNDAGHWVAFLPYLGHTDVVYLGHRPDLPVERIAGALAPKGVTAILRARAWRRTDKIRAPQIVQCFTCVEQVKALLGWGDFTIWTPRQLYRRALWESLKGSGKLTRRRSMGEMIKAPFELVKSIFTGNRGDDPTSGVRKQERAEARRLETEKAARLAALDRQRTGRSSLISTSELGVQDKLGA